MSLDYKTIGQRIKIVRKMKKMSQAKLAEHIDMSVPYISHIETARKKVSLTTLVLIANALGVTVDTFLIGNQTYDQAEYYSEITRIMEDCDNYERRLIYEVVAAVKIALRRSHFFSQGNNENT